MVFFALEMAQRSNDSRYQGVLDDWRRAELKCFRALGRGQSCVGAENTQVEDLLVGNRDGGTEERRFFRGGEMG